MRHAESPPPDPVQTDEFPGDAIPGPPLAELAFDSAYKSFRLRRDELADHHDRVEFWDGATETALVCEAVSPFHERPAHRLAALAERIAAVRGDAIACFGAMSLIFPDENGRPARVMEADQTLYLHPDLQRIVGPEAMVVGENHYPDVVLEVDRTTDVRRHKLKLYEAWRFPELWVDVPDESPRPAAGLRPGMTIHALTDGEFKVVAESRAFPGWTAEQIHLALNEEQLSASTARCLERVGAVLGEREGTGPDDDPMLRSLRRKARVEGLAKGLARAYGKEFQNRAAMVRAVMTARGLEVTSRFPLRESIFYGASVEAVGVAALRCEDQDDFLARLKQASDR